MRTVLESQSFSHVSTPMRIAHDPRLFPIPYTGRIISNKCHFQQGNYSLKNTDNQLVFGNIPALRQPEDVKLMRNSGISLFIVDKRPVIRYGLKDILKSEIDIHVIGETESVLASVDRICDCAPDIVIMDIEHPHDECCEAVRSLHSRGINAIACTDRSDWPLVAMWLQAGGRGYVNWQVNAVDLAKTIRQVASGATHLASHIYDPDRNQSCPLSQRETEVIALIATGYTAPEIASALHISPKTVDTYRSRLSGKLGIKTRSELVRYAIQNGLLTIPDFGSKQTK